jgi:hypothetical protein
MKREKLWVRTFETTQRPITLLVRYVGDTVKLWEKEDPARK